MAVTQSPFQLMTASDFCLDLQTGVAATALCLRKKLQTRCDAPQMPIACWPVVHTVTLNKLPFTLPMCLLESVKHLHGNGPI